MNGRSTVRVVALALLTAGAVAAAADAAQEAAAAYPGKNGKIAFRRYSGADQSTGAIFVVAADGTGEHQITDFKRGVLADQPDWSPDGSLIVFFGGCSATMPCAVWTVRPDGSQLKRLSRPVTKVIHDESNASFTPDGRHVAFTDAWGDIKSYPGGDQIRHSDLVLMDLNGKHRRVLVRSAPFRADLQWPMFSPDASRLLYITERSYFADPKTRKALFVARPDGTHPRRITPWGMDAADTDWSPDGSHIIFRSSDDDDDATQSQLYTVRPDGSELKQMTNVPRGTLLLSATYSPDGTQIVFAKSGDGSGGEQADLYVMNADGTGAHPILTNTQWDSAPDWGTAG